MIGLSPDLKEPSPGIILDIRITIPWLGLRLRDDGWWLEMDWSRGAGGSGIRSLAFTEDHGGRGDGPLNTHLAKSTTHEVGHLIGTGRADDGQQYVIVPKEVYSGDPESDDPTIELVSLGTGVEREWSVMSNGWNDELYAQPMGGRYIAFSIEELSTLEFEDIQTQEDD